MMPVFENGVVRLEDFVLPGEFGARSVTERHELAVHRATEFDSEEYTLHVAEKRYPENECSVNVELFQKVRVNVSSVKKWVVVLARREFGFWLRGDGRQKYGHVVIEKKGGVQSIPVTNPLQICAGYFQSLYFIRRRGDYTTINLVVICSDTLQSNHSA